MSTKSRKDDHTSRPASETFSATDVNFDPLMYNAELFPPGEGVPPAEYEYYKRLYPTVDLICNGKVHCTVCQGHIGVALTTEANITMHPVLRVTLCNTCLKFYYTGEFAKGEDGSELYCRWCGQGGEVYCCSTCPFVFCKRCISLNLTTGVVEDIEKNDNWSCFGCAPKIIWLFRANHWALTAYFATRKKDLESRNLSPNEMRHELNRDFAKCCRLAKAKVSKALSASSESLDSRRSAGGSKRPGSRPSNEATLCTPDLSYLLQDDSLQPPKQQRTGPLKFAPLRPRFGGPQQQAQMLTVGNNPPSSSLPPLVLPSTSVRVVSKGMLNPQMMRTQPYPRPIVPATRKPIYYNVGGFTLDLNSASQHHSIKLPNGKTIQVRRKQQTPLGNTVYTARPAMGQGPLVVRSITKSGQIQQPIQPRIVNVSNGVSTARATPTGFAQRKATVQLAHNPQRPQLQRVPVADYRNVLQRRAAQQMQFFKTLLEKYNSFIQSPAFSQAKTQDDMKALFSNFSYFNCFTIGRLQSFNDTYTTHIRKLGFLREADMLESGQLSAAIDFVRYGQLEDINLSATGADSFHNQVYEYRKSLLANIENNRAEGLYLGDTKIEPLPPLFPLNASNSSYFQNESNSKPADNNKGNDLPIAESDQVSQCDDDNENSNDNDGDNGEKPVSQRTYTHDPKLAKIIRAYPAIWCTRHPDYNNFEKTRKLWGKIAGQYDTNTDLKLRWKYMRKRYVRMEQRLMVGQRVQGRYDKSLNYLANRDLPLEQWKEVDCSDGEGEDDNGEEDIGIESDGGVQNDDEPIVMNGATTEAQQPAAGINSLALLPIEERIIEFVKGQPVIYQRSESAAFNRIDEETRRRLWETFSKSEPDYSMDYIIQRWNHMFGMYKMFRLKLIEDKNILANLQFKYWHYLRKLNFLEKLSEQALREDYKQAAEFSGAENTGKLQQMPDDKEFMLELVQKVRQRPCLWNRELDEYDDFDVRDDAFREIEAALKPFKRNLEQIKNRWSLAAYAFICYQQEFRRPTPDSKVLEKLGKVIPVKEMQFLNA